MNLQEWVRFSHGGRTRKVTLSWEAGRRWYLESKGGVWEMSSLFWLAPKIYVGTRGRYSWQGRPAPEGAPLRKLDFS